MKVVIITAALVFVAMYLFSGRFKKKKPRVKKKKH